MSLNKEAKLNLLLPPAFGVMRKSWNPHTSARFIYLLHSIWTRQYSREKQILQLNHCLISVFTPPPMTDQRPSSIILFFESFPISKSI